MAGKSCNILLVDDHEATRETLAEVLLDAGHEVAVAENKNRACQYIEKKKFDLVLTDLMLPDGTGLEVLELSKKLFPELPVVMITGHGSIENAIEATRLGAYEYVAKPVDLNKLRVIVKNALHLVALERKFEQKGDLSAIVGQSPVITQVKELIKQVAHTDVTVLIEGESGTGKELVANALQGLSSRINNAFVKVNVAALSKDLVESELFGHEKGSFSGAMRLRKGRFEMADKGTLFLDEIGEMPLGMQVKLLRVLQERELERVGGNDTIPVDIRLICATNKDLKTMAEKGDFREDLFYRINVVKIRIPPLRERKEDIEFLAEHFLQKYSSRYNLEKKLSAEFVNGLLAYDWPGNIRELENAIEGAVVRTAGDVIGFNQLPEEISGIVPQSAIVSPNIGNSMFTPGLSLDEIERNYVLSELDRLSGNKTQAAKSLGIGLKTLYRKLELYENK